MKVAEREAEKAVRREEEFTSYFDINQLELALINHALKQGSVGKLPKFVDIGKKERILKIQKKNLERVCQRNGKERREGHLESELKKILSGARIFSMFRRR